MAARTGGDRGASILELAMIMPVMALIVMGVIDLARAYQTNIRLENAAREGAAFSQYYPNDVDCAGSDNDIGDHVLAEDAGLAAMDGFAVVVLVDDGTGSATQVHTGCGGSTVLGGDRVKVQAGASFDVLTPMVERIVGDTLFLTGTAEVEAQG